MSNSESIKIDQETPNGEVKDTTNELKELEQFICEKKERNKLKLELKTKNHNAEALRLDEAQIKRLDSSIKKVTAFIKRLKTLTESQKETLSKEMSQLNLSKYLSEVAAAFTEVKLKMNDVACALHLCSQMHQSYAEFSALLFEQWQKLLNIKKEEKIANPSKLRVDLRFFAELITIGVLGEKEALSLLGNQLTILTTYDKEHANVSIIYSFCKHCGEDFADLTPEKFERLSIKHNLEIPRSTIYSNDRQKAVKCLFKEYFRSLSQHILADHKEIQKQERQNKKTYQTKGELNSEKKEKFEQTISNFKKLLEHAELFADLLGEKMPELPVDESKKDDDIINIDIYTPSGKNEEFDSNTSPWEDEETRQFYELIPDLRALVPGILYKDSEKQPAGQQPAKTTPTTSIAEQSITGENETQASEDQVKKDVENELPSIDIAVEMAQMEKEIQELEKEVDLTSASGIDDEQDLATIVSVDEKDLIIEDETSIVGTNSNQIASSSSSLLGSGSLANANMKALMDSYIAQLPNCVNRELIDKAAKEFCMNLNTKLNRKRLVGALFQVQRTRLDLLPFYARFVATLNPCMPELATDLSSLLLNDFRFHVRKKDQINIESKVKTARFIGELVKFKMFSKLDALNCLKTLLADFKHHNVEMACNLLDVCGRYLYRNQESHMKLKLLLEILLRKKQATLMDGRYSIMIENAYYYCNPPENKQVEKAVLSPIHEYIKKLLYKDLNKLCVEKILRQLRRINWDDEELKAYAIKCLTAAWNVRYNSIHCLANLVSGLALYHEEVGIQVVDGVIENIRLGLETNLPKLNQNRVSMVKYLGELYNYRMVESSIIFKTLYTLLTFGITYDVNELINNENSADPIDNWFRVRLICILLDTCGQYFDRGNTKKKLDCFLLYFQRYYLFKKETALGNNESKPFDPVDVEFVFTETLTNLRNNFKFLKTYAEANEAVEKMEKELRETIAKAAPQILKETSHTLKENIGDEGLDSIREDEEEEDDYRVQNIQNENDEENDEEKPEKDDDDDEEYDEDSYNPDSDNKAKLRLPRASLDTNEYRQRVDSLSHEQNADSNSEVEDSMMILQPRVAKQKVTQEDEEFMKAFDSILTETIAQRTKETIKMPAIDISVPMHLSKKRQSNPSHSEGASDNLYYKELKSLQLNKPPKPASEQAAPKIENTNKNKGFNFVVMIKKGNKTQYHNMEVPLTSEFANQFIAREEAEKAEKEKLKQLTLNINQRIEQEELQEMLQIGGISMSVGNTSSSSINQSKNSFSVNKDRHQRYNHPKGVPDADLIFGLHSNKRQFNDGNTLNRTSYETNKNNKY